MDVVLSFVGWWTTGRIGALAAATSAAVAVVAGGVAVRTLRHNRKAFRRTTRPMMVGYLRLSGTFSASLTVTNAGQSVARNVHVSFTPPLPAHETTEDGQDSLIPFVRHRYSKPIDAWVPGFSARSEFLILGEKRDENGRRTNVDGIPDDTYIEFQYQDDDGTAYNDRMALNPTLIEGETWTVSTRRRNGEETVLFDGSPWQR